MGCCVNNYFDTVETILKEAGISRYVCTKCHMLVTACTLPYVHISMGIDMTSLFTQSYVYTYHIIHDKHNAYHPILKLIFLYNCSALL